MVIPASVQGRDAARSIVEALEAANRISPPLDLVVLSRGGGSLEDLWCFNEEPVVRAVSRSRLPTVSAVGHEVDITLCDLAADLRALTPTDAATRVLPDAELVDQTLRSGLQRLHRSVRRVIDDRRVKVEAVARRPILRKPAELVHLRSRALDELDARARRAIRAQLRIGRTRLQAISGSLSALSPLDVLARGYSITLDASGQPITHAADVRAGDQIRSRLHQGQIESTVIESTESEIS
jgi:exodeoxyribonuclease VII large subunit